MATAINDFIQGIIMLVGIVAVIAAVMQINGGLTESIAKLSQESVTTAGGNTFNGVFASFFGPDIFARFLSGAAEEDCRCTSFRIVRESKALQKQMPGIINFLAKRILTKTPHFNARKCKKCRRCEQICPAHLIKMEGTDSTARLTDKSKCLHCFCCHEICPADAIVLRRF